MAPTPLTVLSPVPRWWALWVRGSWAVARLSSRVAAPLRSLTFIRFAHWSLIERWPRDPAVAPDRAGPRALLFLTTYDGSQIQYFDAFVRIVPRNIRGAYAGAEGFPRRLRFRPIERYLAERVHPVEHFFCAFPDATTRATAQALELARRLERFEDEVAGADARGFATAWRRFRVDVQGLL